MRLGTWDVERWRLWPYLWVERQGDEYLWRAEIEVNFEHKWPHEERSGVADTLDAAQCAAEQAIMEILAGRSEAQVDSFLNYLAYQNTLKWGNDNEMGITHSDVYQEFKSMKDNLPPMETYYSEDVLPDSLD